MRTCGFVAAMMLIQLNNGAAAILIKASLQRGVNQLVFLVYRHLIGFVLLAPFAYVLERKRRPPLTFSIAAWIFMLAFLSSTVRFNAYIAGLAYTSPTVASALNNIVPSLTFLLAVLFRMEKVNIRNARGQAKVFGTLICIIGSLILTFWREGLLKSFMDKPVLNIYKIKGSSKLVNSQEDWIKGSGLVITCQIAWSASLILQTWIYESYPAQLSLNALICFFATLQCGIFSLFFARNENVWEFGWNLELLTIIYCGALSASLYCLVTWCLDAKGPLFVASFNPLMVIFVGIFSAVALAEPFHVTSIVGVLIIIIGLFCVLWGKKKDSRSKELQSKLAGPDDDKALQISVDHMNPITTGEKLCDKSRVNDA